MLPVRTLRSGHEAGEVGPSGLDVGGLDGGQDEGHLPAVRRQLGQQVIVGRRPSPTVRLLARRRRLVLRQPQRDHLGGEIKKKKPKTHGERRGS